MSMNLGLELSVFNPVSVILGFCMAKSVSVVGVSAVAVRILK